MSAPIPFIMKMEGANVSFPMGSHILLRTYEKVMTHWHFVNILSANHLIHVTEFYISLVLFNDYLVDHLLCMSVSKPAQGVKGCVWHITGAPSVLLSM